MKFFSSFFVFTCATFANGLAYKLECSFVVIDMGFSRDLYTCDIKRFMRSNEEGGIVTAVNGKHDEGKTNSDVAALRVEYNSWKFVPNNIDKFFPHLETFQVLNSTLQKVSQQNFVGFSKMTAISLWKNKLTSIDENTFEKNLLLEGLYLSDNQIDVILPLTFAKLKKLKVLHLNGNRIEKLPSNAFSRNVNLKVLHLQDNKLAQIPCGTFDGLTKASIDLRNNECINFKMKKPSGLEALQEQLISCNSDYQCCFALNQKHLEAKDKLINFWKAKQADTQRKLNNCMDEEIKTSNNKMEQRNIFDAPLFRFFFGTWKF